MWITPSRTPRSSSPSRAWRISGATEKDIYEWKLDYDDGRPEYEGKIIYGGTEYEFTIDANTGAIIEWDMESIYD